MYVMYYASSSPQGFFTGVVSGQDFCTIAMLHLNNLVGNIKLFLFMLFSA